MANVWALTLSGSLQTLLQASEIVKADIVYVTHDHHDHTGQAFDICKRTGANFVAALELGNLAKENGLKNVVGLNVGGQRPNRRNQIVRDSGFSLRC